LNHCSNVSYTKGVYTEKYSLPLWGRKKYQIISADVILKKKEEQGEDKRGKCEGIKKKRQKINLKLKSRA
jgi:hypothetical protein